MSLSTSKQTMQDAIAIQATTPVVCRFTSYQTYSFFFYFWPQGQ